jgi:hypothetical protein
VRGSGQSATKCSEVDEGDWKQKIGSATHAKIPKKKAQVPKKKALVPEKKALVPLKKKALVPPPVDLQPSPDDVVPAAAQPPSVVGDEEPPPQEGVGPIAEDAAADGAEDDDEEEEEEVTEEEEAVVPEESLTPKAPEESPAPKTEASPVVAPKAEDPPVVSPEASPRKLVSEAGRIKVIVETKLKEIMEEKGAAGYEWDTKVKEAEIETAERVATRAEQEELRRCRKRIKKLDEIVKEVKRDYKARKIEKEERDTKIGDARKEKGKLIDELSPNIRKLMREVNVDVKRKVKEKAENEEELREIAVKIEEKKAKGIGMGLKGAGVGVGYGYGAVGDGGDGDGDGAVGEGEEGEEELEERFEGKLIEMGEKIEEEVELGILLSKDERGKGSAQGGLGFVGNMVRSGEGESSAGEVFKPMEGALREEEEEKGGRWRVYGKGKYRETVLEGTSKSPGEYKDSQSGGVIGVNGRIGGSKERGFVIGGFIGVDSHKMSQKEKEPEKKPLEVEGAGGGGAGEGVDSESESKETSAEAKEEMKENIIRLEESKGKVRRVVVGINGGYIDPRYEIKMLLRGSLSDYKVDNLGSRVFGSKETKFEGKGIGVELEGKYKIRASKKVETGPWIGVEATAGKYDEDEKRIIRKGDYSRALIGIGWEVKGKVGGVVELVGKVGYKRLLRGEIPKIRIGRIADSQDEKYKKNKEIEGEGIKEGQNIMEIGIGMGIDIGKGLGGTVMGKYAKGERYRDLSANIGLNYNF